MAEILHMRWPRRRTRGTIHVTTASGGGFEIAHESESGDSWGGFEQFDNAGAAIAAAHRMNRDTYEGVCEIYIHPEVRRAADFGGGPEAA